MQFSPESESHAIKQVSFFFSLCFLLACPLAALYTGEWGKILSGWKTLLTSPSPLVTDYFLLGSLPAAFLNAGLCGLACSLLLAIPRVECEPSNWAGYFLVVAHCFYGLNFLNMWLPVLGVFLYCRTTHMSFRDNLDMAMFSTAFGPFVSELFFRYPLGRLSANAAGVTVYPIGIFLSFVLAVFLGFSIPAMLPGAQKLHRGFNLYNGGLAFGLLGMFVYAFLFKTMGVPALGNGPLVNEVYASHGNSYTLFCNIFFLLVFGACLLYGCRLNNQSFAGYSLLLQDSGHRTDFLQKYGVACTWLNLGFYGLMMVGYFDLVILFTKGVGFTGATCGVTLAAMTFAASGQHPKNVWPILAGYLALSVGVSVFCLLAGQPIPWTLSTQGYINGVAFATGLCPFTGCYGKRIGMAAGAICAAMCTTSSAMHGGFVLYNGGLTAGITALILLPMLDLYYHGEIKK